MIKNGQIPWKRVKGGGLLMRNLVKVNKNLVNFWIMAKPGSEVFVAGTFNNWSVTANPLKGNSSRGHYIATLAVCPGRHEYKFVVDGVWQVDPSCPVMVANPFGSENSVLQVEKPDIQETEQGRGA